MNLLSSSSSSASGYFWIILTAFFWSLVGVLSKVCMAEGVTPLETAFWRAAFGLLFFLGHTLATRQIAVPPRAAASFILFGVWGIGVFYSVTQYAIKLSGAAMSVVLMYTAPIWVAVISRVLFGEAISGRKLSAIGVALCGTALVCFSGGSLPGQHSWVGIACGIIIGMSYASHYPFYRWWQNRYSAATIYFYSLVGGLAALYLVSPLHFNHSPRVWLCLVLLGACTSYFAYLCYGLALKRIGLVRAAVTCYLEPVLSTLWVWLFWQESFTLMGWLGSILVLGAVLLLSLDRSGD
ncbi:EamA family transporter [uncultured Desulfovibrio sp.]|uniref:DMT family transporter n=1 Tax=uncultured Desulfovibrio sp. TaxID=167968 RepID=UPI002627E72A|nr:EamA family transporter [uncultured Desulfovibrio sp.]